jgi:hypothetical protein
VTRTLALLGVAAAAATPAAFAGGLDQGGPPEDPGVTAVAHCTVPAVRGARLAEAKRRVLKARCGVSGVMRKRSKTAQGRIVAVVPWAGTVLAEGTGVLLVVSR